MLEKARELTLGVVAASALLAGCRGPSAGSFLNEQNQGIDRSDEKYRSYHELFERVRVAAFNDPSLIQDDNRLLLHKLISTSAEMLPYLKERLDGLGPTFSNSSELSARLLSQSSDPVALTILCEAALSSRDPSVRNVAIQGLGYNQSVGSMNVLISIASSNEISESSQAIWALSNFHNPQALYCLLQLAKEEDYAQIAAEALRENLRADSSNVKYVMAALHNPDSTIQHAAVYALAGLQDQAVLPYLRSWLAQATDPQELIMAISCVRDCGMADPKVVKSLLEIMLRSKACPDIASIVHSQFKSYGAPAISLLFTEANDINYKPIIAELVTSMVGQDLESPACMNIHSQFIALQTPESLLALSLLVDKMQMESLEQCKGLIRVVSALVGFERASGANLSGDNYRESFHLKGHEPKDWAVFHQAAKELQELSSASPGQQLAQKICTRFEQAKAIDITNPFRFGESVWQEILNNRQPRPDDARPKVVITISAHDYNGAFSNMDRILQPLIDAGVRILVYEVGNEDSYANRDAALEIVDALGDARALDHPEIPILGCIFAGHGNPESIALTASGTGHDKSLSWLDLGDQVASQLITAQIDQDGWIILFSCSTGKDKHHGNNVANMFEKNRKGNVANGVIAPVADSSIDVLLINPKDLRDVKVLYNQWDENSAQVVSVEAYYTKRSR